MKNIFRLLLLLVVLQLPHSLQAEIISHSKNFTFDTMTGELTFYKDVTDVSYKGSDDKWHHIFELFKGKTDLIKTINVEEGATTIHFAELLKDLPNLTILNLPSTLTTIKANNFQNCPKLKSVNLTSKEMVNIELGAFQDCNGLTSFTVNSLKTSQDQYGIGKSFLAGCTGTLYINGNNTSKNTLSASKFTTIDFGEDVTDANGIDFGNNKSIKFVIFHSEVPPMESVLNLHKNTFVFVPTESIESYKAKWPNLADQLLPFDDEETGLLLVDGTTYRDYKHDLGLIDKSTVTNIFMPNLYETDLTESTLKKGINPNCLFYVPAASELNYTNVVKCDGLDCYAEHITLDEECTYKAMQAFHADYIELQHTPIVWANGKSGWETICLPFKPDTYKASSTGNIWPITLGGQGNFWLRKFTGSSDESLFFSSTLDGIMEANTPYMVAFPGSSMGKGHLEGQTITFSASNVDIPVTVAPELKKGGFTFTGNYDTEADDACGWVLDNNGLEFVNSATVGTEPFRAYFAQEGMSMGAGVKALRMEFVTEDVDGMLMVPEEGSQCGSNTLYDLSGRRTTKSGKGIYIKNGKKVVM